MADLGIIKRCFATLTNKASITASDLLIMFAER